MATKHQHTTTTTAPGSVTSTLLDESPQQLSEGNSAAREDRESVLDSKESAGIVSTHGTQDALPDLFVGRLLQAVASGSMSLSEGDRQLSDRHCTIDSEQRQALRDVLLKYRTIAERLLQQYDSLPV